MHHQVDMGAFGQLLGMQVLHWAEGEAIVSLEIRPEFLNRSQVLHGGIVAALIDTTGGYAGIFCPVPGHVRRAFTLSMTSQFTGQTKSGQIRANAKLRHSGRNIFFAETGVFDDAGTLIGFGAGTYRYREGHGDLHGIPLNDVR